jgi:peptidyl-prolyl cis-trans isomerase D
MAKIIIGLMIVPFAFFGVESLLSTTSGQLNVAVVNGEEISLNALDQAVRSQRQQMINTRGDNLDPNLLTDEYLRTSALNELIQKSLLLQLAEEESLGVSVATLDQAIIAMPQFQQDGKFDPQLYTNLLRSNGLTSNYFKQLLQEDMAISQLNSGFANSDFSSEKELAVVAKIINQNRSYRYLTIGQEQVSDGIEISQEMIEEYYQANLDQFQTEDRVKLAYIDVHSSDFFQPVDEDQIREAYELEMVDFVSDEERRVSHILIETGELSEDDAEARANELAARLAAGEDFAALAAEFSDDTGSSTAGGDLGYTSGDAFPAEFEDALFDLALNEVSAPVQTDSGFHLIKATEINVIDKPSYEDRKEVLQERIQLAEAEAEFVTTVEDLRDLVFNSEDLVDPAKELGLQVVQSDWVSVTTAEGPIANPQVLVAAYSDSVLLEGNNSEVLELASDNYIVIRVLDHDEPHAKPLADVSEEISGILVKQEAIAKAQNLAEEVKVALADKPMADIANENGYRWEVQANTQLSTAVLNSEVKNLAFAMPQVQGESIVEINTLANGDVVVLQLESVEEGELDNLASAERTAIAAEIERNYASQSLSGFLESLKARAEVVIL